MKEIEDLIGKENMKIAQKTGNMVLLAFPIFMLVRFYAHGFTRQYDEEIATSATICLLTGIYTGRYISTLWLNSDKDKQNLILFCLPILIIVSGFFVAFIGNQALNHREIFVFLSLFLAFFTCSFLIGMFIKLIRHRIQTAEVTAANSQTELQLLQSQLSPHFLFNTLNNLYGLSITQHEKIPPLLLKLSDLLRYSVYDTKELFVPLKDELAYINNYIDFEKIRIGERLVLTTAIEDVASTEIKIAPMLLIVFIENAFKHAKNTADDYIFIDITLKIWGNSILFSVKNSHDNTQDESNVLNKNSGFGLASVRKRLELLYAHTYDLKVVDEGGFYHAMLQVKKK